MNNSLNIEKQYKVCCYCGNTVSFIDGFYNPEDLSKDFYKRYSYSDICCKECFKKVVLPTRAKNYHK